MDEVFHTRVYQKKNVCHLLTLVNTSQCDGNRDKWMDRWMDGQTGRQRSDPKESALGTKFISGNYMAPVNECTFKAIQLMSSRYSYSEMQHK